MLNIFGEHLTLPDIALRPRAAKQVQAAGMSWTVGQRSAAGDCLGTYGTNPTRIGGGRPTSSPDRWTG